MPKGGKAVENLQGMEQLRDQPNDGNGTQGSISSPRTYISNALSPQSGGSSCGCGSASGTCNCGGNSNGSEKITYPYIYALGRIEPRFPSLGVEKEFAQATGRAETAGLTDRQALRSILSERPNRYLARQLCYVLMIEGLETYILRPRDPMDFDLLVEAVRPAPRFSDVDVVIGVRGPLAPPELCNGLMVPIVVFDQLYSFDTDVLISSIPRPEAMTAEQFTPVAEELFIRIMQMADNAGATDEHRALNYLAVRFPAIYATTADQHAQNYALTGVDVRPSRLSGVRKIVDVIISYTHRQNGVRSCQ
jgi:hypothetical protein